MDTIQLIRKLKSRSFQLVLKLCIFEANYECNYEVYYPGGWARRGETNSCVFPSLIDWLGIGLKRSSERITALRWLMVVYRGLSSAAREQWGKIKKILQQCVLQTQDNCMKLNKQIVYMELCFHNYKNPGERVWKKSIEFMFKKTDQIIYRLK